MPYIVTTTSGTALATIPDNTVNASTTSITLVGKNYAGYGSFLNENYIKLLENFNNTTAPNSPLQGQMWYDSANALLKVYNGSDWKQLHTAAAGTTAPSSPVTGDLWWDTANSLLKVWAGSSWVSVGTTGGTSGGTGTGASTTGAIADTIVDTLSASHAVLKLSIANNIIAIISKDTSSFVPATAIPGFSAIYPGLNLINTTSLTGSQFTSSQVTVGNNSTLTINDATGEVKLVSNANNVDMNFYVNKANVSTKVFGVSGSTGAVTFTGASTFSAQMLPSVNNTIEIGSNSYKFANVWATTFRGTAVTASYADLAERFEADQPYPAGTVVALGGVKEITAAAEDLCDEVFGVISTRAGFLMNGLAGSDATHPPVAVNGRVPVRVVGRVKKGDRLVSAGNGRARSATKTEITAFNVIGRSLEDKYTIEEDTIEAIVRLNN